MAVTSSVVTCDWRSSRWNRQHSTPCKPLSQKIHRFACKADTDVIIDKTQWASDRRVNDPSSVSRLTARCRCSSQRIGDCWNNKSNLVWFANTGRCLSPPDCWGARRTTERQRARWHSLHKLTSAANDPSINCRSSSCYDIESAD